MKTARIFRNGQSQAVRLPKEFRFEDDFVYIKKSGNAVILIPAKNSWDRRFPWPTGMDLGAAAAR